MTPALQEHAARRAKRGRIAPPLTVIAPPAPGAALLEENEATDWKPRGAPTKVKRINFWTFLTADDLGAYNVSAYRPSVTGLKSKMRPGVTRPSTGEEVWRKVNQVYEGIGYDVAAYKAEHGVEPWEVELPLERIYQWCGPRTKRASRKGHQMALKWLCAYWGLTEATLPIFLAENWYAAEIVDRARGNGDIETRERYFTRTQIETLLASYPYTDTLLAGRLRRSKKHLREAMHKDRTCQYMVFQGIYKVPRPCEWILALLETFDIRARKVVDWRQEKKDKKPRNFSLPEEHVFASPSPAYQTDEWYFRTIRPQDASARAPLLQLDGTPYKRPDAMLAKFIKKVLGPDSPGPHGLRRYGITEAYLAGWTEDAICKLAGDTWDVIKASYIDWDRVDETTRRTPNDKNPKPARPMLCGNGKRTLWKPQQEGAPVVEALPPQRFSSQVRSGSVQI